MKIVPITTTLVVVVLAIGLLGINNSSSSSNNIDNAYAQEGAITPGGMNTTMMPSGGNVTGENKTIPGQMVTNATLVN